MTNCSPHKAYEESVSGNRSSQAEPVNIAPFIAGKQCQPPGHLPESPYHSPDCKHRPAPRASRKRQWATEVDIIQMFPVLSRRANATSVPPIDHPNC
jgi:hypothetical protein